MPRYFFNTIDGDRFHDDEGVDLADDTAARREALVLLGEVLRERGDAFWKTGRFTLSVVDEDGGTVASLTTEAAEAGRPAD